ncbi:MAG: inverse autotransporter beta domain-containing protein [Verrucomicrobia bacterium]|nr:inverse autotransporter beta domain-containing protein [Verrucomicrobiota bacterium]
MSSKISAILATILISPVLLSAYVKGGQAPQRREAGCCMRSPRPERVEFKHIEANGVGYKNGYSSMTGFFTVPSTLDGSWVPFLELRGHIFNDGKPAVNGGVGLRYLGDSRIWGFNTFYDYRETHRFHYNQVGFGFETLGEIWDFRVNAYIPVGKKSSPSFHTHEVVEDFFMLDTVFSSRHEVAMIGANAEVAAHVLRKENYKLYAATGPYYFERQGRVAWGGEGRVALTLFDHVRLQLSGSYDPVFHGIVQGEVAFMFSFGGKRSIKQSSGCDRRYMIQERALQKIDRNEIIVVTPKHSKTKAEPIAPDLLKLE